MKGVMNIFMKNKKIFTALGFMGVLFFSAFGVEASVVIESNPGLLYTKSPFLIPIVITTTDTINAIEGDFIVPEGLTILNVREGSSVVSFWVERPTIKANRIHFAGIIPGGVSGSNLTLFTLEGKAEESGTFRLEAEKLSALLNDGKGTPEQVVYQGKPFVVRALLPGEVAPKLAKDTTPPSPLVLTRATDQNLYGGNPFVVFETTDKESGIARYESFYSFLPANTNDPDLPWQEVQSPLVLEKSFLPTYLYVRAVDTSGNTQVAVLSPQKSDFKYLALLVFVMIGVFLVAHYWRARRFRS